MKATIYTKNQIISTIISKQNDSDMLADTIPADMREKIINRVNEKLNEKIQILNTYSDVALIAEFHKQSHNAQLKVFAPGLYFVATEFNNYTCQII